MEILDTGDETRNNFREECVGHVQVFLIFGSFCLDNMLKGLDSQKIYYGVVGQVLIGGGWFFTGFIEKIAQK